jgi:hypothetical protein
MMSINWSYTAETVIVTGLDEIPGVGNILAGLVEIFWPGGEEDVWKEIFDKVKALVQQAITKDVYGRVQTKLGSASEDSGLIGVLKSYIDAKNKTNGQDPKDTWISANETLINSSAAFEQQGYEVLLLPLFAQMANLHLTLLRDGAYAGYCDVSELQQYINLYDQWAEKYLAQGIASRQSKSDGSYNYLNTFVRFMQLHVGNYSDLWPRFDYTKSFPPLEVSKEIYYTITEACGFLTGGHNYSPPTGLPWQITNIALYWIQETDNVWNFVEGAQLNYSDYSNGAYPYSGVLVNGQAPPLGQYEGGYNYYELTNVGVSSSNPIVSVQGLFNSSGAVYCVEFTFKNDSSSGQIPSQQRGLVLLQWSARRAVRISALLFTS